LWGDLGTLVHNSCFREIAEHVAHRFPPGKSVDKIVAYLERFAATAERVDISTKDGQVTFWKRGLEVLIRGDGLRKGTYFKGGTKEHVRNTLEGYLASEFGISLPLF
jgi:hypothetical protein